MNLQGKRIAFGLTDVFYTFKNTIIEMKNIIDIGGEILPIMSIDTYSFDNKYKNFEDEIEDISCKKIIKGVEEVEKIEADILIIVPCSRKYYLKTCNKYI